MFGVRQVGVLDDVINDDYDDDAISDDDDDDDDADTDTDRQTGRQKNWYFDLTGRFFKYKTLVSIKPSMQ